MLGGWGDVAAVTICSIGRLLGQHLGIPPAESISHLSIEVPFLSGEVTSLSGSAAALLVHHLWMVLSEILGSGLNVFVYVVLFFFVFIVLYYFNFIVLYYICVYNYHNCHV